MFRLTDLREILRYVPQFRDKVFVIALDGAVVEDDNFGNLLLDIAFPSRHIPQVARIRLHEPRLVALPRADSVHLIPQAPGERQHQQRRPDEELFTE